MITALLMLAVSICFAQTTEGLPVLSVTFDGAFSTKMDYINGKMKLTDIDGSIVELPAKFKTRGATAENYQMKPSFNMKLNNADYTESLDSTLLGLRSCSSWILDAMAIDRICMRNRVAFDIWNDFSKLPYETSFDSRNGTAGRFVEVYINGKYNGIYCLTDKINRKLLNLKKVKENVDKSVTIRGVLYKNGTQDIERQEERSFKEDYSACVVSWHNAWELSDPDDYPCREAWEPLLDAYDNGNSIAYVNKYFDLNNLADYQTFIMALSIADNWGNKNRYFSIRNITKDIDSENEKDAANRKIIITPWDLDTSLGGSYNGSYYNGKYSSWAVADISKSSVYPFSLCNSNTTYKNILRASWIKARNGAMSVSKVKSRLYEYRDLFINTGAWKRMTDHFDKEKYKPCYVSDLAKEIDYIVEWYSKRFDEMDKYFDITESDGIEIVEKRKNNNAVYDITGRRVKNIKSSGLYIQNGKIHFHP